MLWLYGWLGMWSSQSIQPEYGGIIMDVMMSSVGVPDSYGSRKQAWNDDPSVGGHHWGLPMVPTLCKSPLSRTLLHSRTIGNHHAYGSILVASFPSKGRDNAVVCLSSTVWSSRPPTLGHFNAQILGHLRVRFGQNSQVNDPVSVEIILVSSFIWETRLGF